MTPVGKYLTMTATDPACNTSEFSKCAKVAAARPGSLQFNASVSGVFEEAGSVSLLVGRINGSDGAVSVHYATSDGTATAGSDYTATSGTLSWGDASTKTITIPITLASAADAAQFLAKLETVAGVQAAEPLRSQLISAMQGRQRTAAQTLRSFVESDAVQASSSTALPALCR